MDPKHKELLEQCQRKLSESVTDVDRVLELLAQSGCLSPAERAELDANSSGGAEKVLLLLRTLLEKKDRDHFQEFCWALEKTQPLLLGALLPVENHHSSGSTCSVLSAMPSDSESSSSLSSVASSPPPAHLDKHVMSEKLETVIFQLRQVTRERDDLRKRLALSSPGTTFDDCRPSVKPGHDYERLKLQCMKAMSDLQSLQNQHTKTLKRCEEAARDADYYHTLHGRVFGEQTQLRDEMEAMKQNYSQLLQQHSQLQQTCDELRRIHDSDQREVADMRLQQQQKLYSDNGGEFNNQEIRDMAENFNIETRTTAGYSPWSNGLLERHNQTLTEIILKVKRENGCDWHTALDWALMAKNSMLNVHGYSPYQLVFGQNPNLPSEKISFSFRFESLQQELNKASAQNEELQRETDRLQMENTRYKTLQLKAVKDGEKLKEERDSVLNEYRLIMSERDQVIKEVDKLQTGLEAAEAKLKNTSSERRVTSEEIEALRQELNSALLDRDRAIREKTELLEKYCHEVQDKAETQKELSQACKDIEMVREERDVARKERTEAIIQRDQLLREYYQARQKQDSATLDIERVSKELEILRKQCEAVSEELQESVQEAEVAKCRRDWAFQERDKIVAERESIRTLCDNLRRERDRAVSDLADALRNLDDLRKQKNDAVRELKELKECMEEQLEKEARFRQLMAHNSHDSAIDTDSLEWETETVEFERSTDDMDLSALGFDIAEGVSDPYLPGDYGIFVSKVDKGSVAEGRLRVNDWLLKINDVDLANKDRKQVIKAVFSGGGVINMVVRRRKSLGGRMVTSVHLTLAGHKDCGVGLESGVFVSSVSPGSPAARDGSVCPGDRILNPLSDQVEVNEVSKCVLRECMEEQLEKEARFRQLMAHNSHDSAIDTDSLEWETETVEFERSTDDMDLSALGFDIAEGVSDPYLPGDYGIFVSKVDKGSVAEGRLRVNDWLLKINDVDLANKDRKQVIKAVFSGGGVINMVVRRRKSLGGRMVTSVHLTLAGHKDCGVGLESGVFVSSVSPGSPAARDGSVCPGDRILNINGISLDNKSVSECESLLRSCRDSVSLSLLKFFPQSLSGQSIAESQRDCERNSSADHLRPCRKQPTHKDMYSPTRDVESERGQRGTLYHEICCPHPTSKRALTFHPVSPGDCITVEMSQERRCIPQKQSGGTWPKMVAVAMTTAESIPPLSIFKTPKKRKSIFDADMFKRPETPSKLDYLSLSQMPKHSPQSSWIQAAPQIPPDPPKRSDSFKFKHKPQGSSASDSTVTTGSPPATPIQTTPADKTSPDFENRDRNGNVLQRQGSGGGGGSFVEEVPGKGADELEMRRGRPNSAPAQRRSLTPLKMPFSQSFSHDEHSPEPVDLVRFSPFRSNRHSFSPVQAHTAPRTLSPYPAVTAVMRNPVYTAWSHCVKTTNSPSVPAHTYTQVSPQHQGRWSVDLNHKRSTELFDGSRGSVQHNTNSLPSSARQGLSQYREQRIKIPSTPRYARSAHGSDRGSLSHSDCSSPSLVTPPLSPLDSASFTSSQSQGSISAQTRLSVSPVPIDRRRDRPYIEEPRCVTIPKGAEPLGISIVGGENGGIFVSKVTGGSIAQQHRLEFGDQLLEFNGINLRNATEQQARLIIGQQCDTITILAQYNPHMHQLGNHSRSSSRMESSISSHSTPDTYSNIDTLSEQDEGTMTPPSKQATPTASPHRDRKQAEPRLVVLRKTQVDLGLKICGGNLTGVFVEALEEDSPARGAEGLQPGDLILECNSVSLKKKTAEEVYLEMLKPSENVTLRVQHRPEHFRRVKEAPADGFYIRALFDHVGDLEQELSFKKDDILYVDDTMPGGNLGYWLAWQLDENARKLVRGHVPSKCMIDQESQRRYSVMDDSGSGKTLSAAARRSFFRRKLKHKRSSSKDGRDAPAADAVSTDSMPFMDDCLSPAYQRVQKVESTNRRPVLILGPLIEPIKDMLLREAPGKYCRCLAEGMKAAQQAIERGVKDCLFIDYKRRSGHFDVTTVASIKEITEKDCHCLLDIAPHAIERLHVVNIYPIIIFIRYRNAKQIKEQKDPVYLRDKVSQKHSKEQFESAQRIEQDYSKYFTGVVQAGGLSNICTQIMAIVDQEQNKVLWIPDGSM
ncbi:disks large homolog 5-like [Sinocyclocheilus grahami]|uniref:disks large homolog 5-like n=1 Tax=Sinocyclocheilus grahami TaxID=75366 RepID=UPI0007ACEC1D|nr:PREDICTED: disks large homolog 5-like [Sinocyclocheilus grahami]